jgi:hypothetical protein
MGAVNQKSPVPFGSQNAGDRPFPSGQIQKVDPEVRDHTPSTLM